MFLYFMLTIVKLALWLRYRIRIKGLEECLKAGNKGILFLPNHPALIDPVIVSSVLMKPFKTWALADEKQIRNTFLKHFYKSFRIMSLPDIGIAGRSGHEKVMKQLEKCVECLKAGDNLLFYPAGRIYRSKMERLRANGGVARIMELYPEVRIVLIRTTGLWGSDFSRAKGYQISFAEGLMRHIKHILLNGIFFGPRREVTIEIVEKPADFPTSAEREPLNRYLENFYNVAMTPNTYVPYTWFEGGGVRYLPEPDAYDASENTSRIPAEVREKVYAKLHAITGKAVSQDSDTLGAGLGLDSLMVAEVHAWIQDEFGYEVNSPETLRTVASLLIAAIGESSSTEPLRPIPASWFLANDPAELFVQEGEKITDIFLKNAKLRPNRPILADQAKGILTNRKIILSILALKDSLAALPGERIGIIMPASSVSTVIYLAALFAGKIPVMVNFTVGLRNMRHCLKNAGVSTILTANIVIEKLRGKGVDFAELAENFVYLEDLAGNISKFSKIKALLRSRFCWSTLRKAKVQDTAVILFTSGSETLPKAVPLTHTNLLTDLRSAMADMQLRQDDCILGILPPFHSFGILLNVMMPCCTNVRIAYHANPMEGDMLARLIAAYKATMAVATPTFVANFLRNATPAQVASIRVVITGAEKCTDAVYDLIINKCPDAVVLEGYGITECSPIVALNKPGRVKAGTIGHILDCMEWAITDEQCQRRLPTGQTGMLIVRGANVFSGYLNYDGASPFVEFEGKSWYRTGDLIAVDNDGFMVFKGRLKRFVKIGGEMVSLPALEEILINHYRSENQDGPVLAVESLGEELHPEITLFSTLPLKREDVNQVIRDAGLPPINTIRNIVAIKEIPVLGTGKVDYRTLKTMV